MQTKAANYLHSTSGAESWEGPRSYRLSSPLPPSQAKIAAMLESDLPIAGPEATTSPGLYSCHGANCGRTYKYVDEPSVGAFQLVETSNVFLETNDVLDWYLQDIERVFVIADGRVWPLFNEEMVRYFQRWPREVLTHVLPRLANNEQNKSIRNYAQIACWLGEKRASARDLVLAFGGGVTTDLAGFVATTYRRGLRRINLPTTLISMTDAALSCKTAVNISCAKNAVGTLKAPDAVIVDPCFLKTVSRIDLLAGLAEIAKLAIVRSPALFSYLESHGVEFLHRRSTAGQDRDLASFAARLFLQMKWEEPFPGNRPASLRSFGHSFSRQLETLSKLALPHGLAVAVEINVATQLAYRLGVLSETARDRIVELLRKLGLPSNCQECRIETVWPVFDRRFKTFQPFYFPVPEGIGKGTFVNRFTRTQLATAIDVSART